MTVARVVLGEPRRFASINGGGYRWSLGKDGVHEVAYLTLPNLC